MTTDKARKRQVRARMARTGESYTEAARAVGCESGKIRRPEDLDALPGAALPVPVAVMVARNFAASAQHLAVAHRLATDHAALAARGAEVDSLDEASSQVRKWIYHLERYAERSAVSSGVIAELPELLGGRAISQTLYPSQHLWCASGPRRSLPQPGEDPARDLADNDRVRHLLGGRVPTTRLADSGEGQHLVNARDVVPGTPAAPIWRAHEELNRYAANWTHRAGDAPGDLAAALEGCAQVLDEVVEVAAGLLAEIQRRTEDGTMTGVDVERITKARNEIDVERLRRPRTALRSARRAIDGAFAALPVPRGVRVSDSTARKLSGSTAAEIRDELGGEVALNIRTGKVAAPETGRAAALARVLAWMHYTGADTYDPDRHAAADPARAEG
ncbi:MULTISPECIES: hypothetical protein [unclassified Nocardia]|uniref:hypothetical protein n=1 Tax=unclassified Nocardia TaxID=2637762 RepID=UPI001CE425B3|nr:MULTISPECIES: hypothetical protein [unclassified Nocardia]